MRCFLQAARFIPAAWGTASFIFSWTSSIMLDMTRSEVLGGVQLHEATLLYHSYPEQWSIPNGIASPYLGTPSDEYPPTHTVTIEDADKDARMNALIQAIINDKDAVKVLFQAIRDQEVGEEEMEPTDSDNEDSDYEVEPATSQDGALYKLVLRHTMDARFPSTTSQWINLGQALYEAYIDPLWSIFSFITTLISIGTWFRGSGKRVTGAIEELQRTTAALQSKPYLRELIQDEVGPIVEEVQGATKSLHDEVRDVKHAFTKIYLTQKTLTSEFEQRYEDDAALITWLVAFVESLGMDMYNIDSERDSVPFALSTFFSALIEQIASIEHRIKPIARMVDKHTRHIIRIQEDDKAIHEHRQGLDRSIKANTSSTNSNSDSNPSDHKEHTNKNVKRNDTPRSSASDQESRDAYLRSLNVNMWGCNPRVFSRAASQSDASEDEGPTKTGETTKSLNGKKKMNE